jgi:hypothetical protein
LPRTQSVQSSQSTRATKTLCIIDTCSLVYMARVKLARKSLRTWLWEEFDVKYSEAVLNEFLPFTANLGIWGKWEKDVQKVPNLINYERAVFSSHQKQIEAMYCNCCKQRTWKYEMFTPNLTGNKDKGERHNCCLALHAIIEGRCSQIIFLTDDLRARSDYTTYFFDVFPIGTVWSLLDFITYLFVRHWKDIPLENVKDALRDVNSEYNKQPGGIGGQGQQDGRTRYEESEKKRHRLHVYSNKVERIHQIFSQI